MIMLDYSHVTDLRALGCDAIMFTTQIYKGSQSVSEIFRLPFFNSSYVNNLKDAIVHFKRLDREYGKIDPTQKEITDNHLQVFMQFEFLSEHLTRGLIDAYVEIFQDAGHFYEMFLDCLVCETIRGRLTSQTYFISLVRKAMHFCKKSYFDLRSIKLDLFRIADGGSVGYSGGVTKPIVLAKTAVAQYQEILKFLPDSPLGEVYGMVATAFDNDYSIFTLNDNDTPELVADVVGYSAEAIISLNKLSIRKNHPFPKDLKWVLYEEPEEMFDSFIN